MKKTVLIITIGIVLIMSFGVYAEKVVSKYGVIERNDWNIYDNDSNRFDSLEEFLAEVDYYVEEIINYLNIKFDKKVLFTFEEGFGTRADYIYCRVTLGVLLFENDMLPIAHEITHILAPSSNDSLSEGLAEYMQDKFGKTPSDTSLGFPINSLAKELFENIDANMVDGIVNGGIMVKYMDYNEIFNFYLFSYSFVTYLIDQYGIEKFMNFYESDGYIQYQSLFGKNEEKMKKEWVNFLKDQTSLDLEEWKNKKREILYKYKKIMENKQ